MIIQPYVESALSLGLTILNIIDNLAIESDISELEPMVQQYIDNKFVNVTCPLNDNTLLYEMLSGMKLELMRLNTTLSKSELVLKKVECYHFVVKKLCLNGTKLDHVNSSGRTAIEETLFCMSPIRYFDYSELNFKCKQLFLDACRASCAPQQTSLWVQIKNRFYGFSNKTKNKKTLIVIDASLIIKPEEIKRSSVFSFFCKKHTPSNVINEALFEAIQTFLKIPKDSNSIIMDDFYFCLVFHNKTPPIQLMREICAPIYSLKRTTPVSKYHYWLLSSKIVIPADCFFGKLSDEHVNRFKDTEEPLAKHAAATEVLNELSRQYTPAQLEPSIHHTVYDFAKVTGANTDPQTPPQSPFCFPIRLQLANELLRVQLTIEGDDQAVKHSGEVNHGWLEHFHSVLIEDLPKSVNKCIFILDDKDKAIASTIATKHEKIYQNVIPLQVVTVAANESSQEYLNHLQSEPAMTHLMTSSG